MLMIDAKFSIYIKKGQLLVLPETPCLGIFCIKSEPIEANSINQDGIAFKEILGHRKIIKMKDLSEFEAKALGDCAVFKTSKAKKDL